MPSPFRALVHFAALCAIMQLPSPAAPGAWIWVEGEKPATQTMHRHPWWYDQVQRDALSGGDFISNFSKLVLSTDAFTPRGALKPDQVAQEAARQDRLDADWLPFDPAPDAFTNSPIDLRRLNEQFAGEHGFIGVKDGAFVRTGDGQPVRFWAVNGPPGELADPARLRQAARLLAKHGVNLVRVHGGLFDPKGDVDPAKVRRALAVVEAMKAEGVYTHFSVYFPLWMTPKAGDPTLAGYDGTKHPFAALFFNPGFQAQYRKWLEALLLTPGGADGKRLVDEPAVFGLEMQNEDSFFFWTFTTDGIPDAQLRPLEKRFGDWLAKKHGSIDAALAAWKNQRVARDAPAEGRVSFRPLWSMFHEKSARDRDTAAFLLEVQTQFYAETRDFIRKLGFKGTITASNWITASPEVFGPLEKLSYTAGEFIDRHGYFGCNQKEVRFTDGPGGARVADLAPFVDRRARTLTSTTGELKLDYGKGVLRIDAARAQGLSGALKEAGATELKEVAISSGLELGHVLVVALDGQPLASSGRMLLQVMSEEQTTGWATEAAGAGVQKIVHLGHDPWRIRKLDGVVRFKRADAAQLQVTALDFNGYPVAAAGTAREIRLRPGIIYYLVSK